MDAGRLRTQAVRWIGRKTAAGMIGRDIRSIAIVPQVRDDVPHRDQLSPSLKVRLPLLQERVARFLMIGGRP